MAAGISFGVLGPVTAWGPGGEPLPLRGPRHREVLARLVLARRRVVPLPRLVADLWPEQTAGAAGAAGTVQSFVATLRRALEPDRPRRAPATLLVTEGPGYALRAAPDSVDAWRFETALTTAATLPPEAALPRLTAALDQWRGPAYAEYPEAAWAQAERARLTELHRQAVERRAEAQLAIGDGPGAVAGLEAHLAEHPWREGTWRLPALALYRSGRQADALAVLRRARTALAEELGLAPGPELRRLEADLLAQAPHLAAPADPETAAERLWQQATAAYARTVSPGARSRLESTVGLLRGLAVTGPGGLTAAREQRLPAVLAGERYGDPALTARVITAYDVPANWPRPDDPPQALALVAAAERTLAALTAEPTHTTETARTTATTPTTATTHTTATAHTTATTLTTATTPTAEAGPAPTGEATAPARARLLATIALELRGTRAPRGPQAAAQAERIARELDDPALLAFALNGRYLQSFDRPGLAPRRGAIGAELTALAARHGLASFEVLGLLIQLQSAAALGEFAEAEAFATAVDRLADRHERPLARLFTAGFRALRLAATGRAAEAGAAYAALAAPLEGAGMPGVTTGLLPLARLGLRYADGPSSAPPALDPAEDWGPYRPWILPFTAAGPAEARATLRAQPEPPPDLLQEALLCLRIAAARDLADQATLARAQDELRPAAGQLAGAASGFLSFGPVDRWLSVTIPR
ncbi:SARP family transcriptional regulator [Kitasatospora sp. MMS16-BH015]|nr:SARP family transcriptional regulator [Kitasatospora sp. MMS16-BH015]